MNQVTITTYGCAEYLCHIGLLPGELEYRPKFLKIDDIQRAVAHHFRVPLFEMKSERRSRDVARPRQVAMYLCRELTRKSMPNIGHHFGNRDHTTVLHACRQIDKLRKDDPFWSGTVRKLIAELRA